MKPTYSNDKTAPRMKKGKYSTQVVTKELWKEFLEKYPEYKAMTWNTFYAYWQDIAKTIVNETVTNPLGVKLGSYTGELKLQYLPHKMEAADMHTSAELGEKVKHLNLVSKGKVGKIKWERRWAVKFNRMLQFYAFEPIRELKVLAKKYMDSNPEKVRVARNTLGGFSVWRKKP